MVARKAAAEAVPRGSLVRLGTINEIQQASDGPALPREGQGLFSFLEKGVARKALSPREIQLQNLQLPAARGWLQPRTSLAQGTMAGCQRSALPGVGTPLLPQFNLYHSVSAEEAVV